MGRRDPDDRATSPPGRTAFALARIRRSPVLRACMVLAFVEYGALLVLAVFGERIRGADGPAAGLWFPFAGWLALCSLGSWFFLFLWFPMLQSVERQIGDDQQARFLGRVLEGFAVLCVAVVHGLLLWILVRVVLRA